MLSKFCQLHQLIFLSQIFPPIISYGWYQLRQSKFVAHPTVEFYQLCRHVRFCFVFRHWTKNYVNIALLLSSFLFYISLKNYFLYLYLFYGDIFNCSKHFILFKQKWVLLLFNPTKKRLKNQWNFSSLTFSLLEFFYCRFTINFKNVTKTLLIILHIKG